jgi:hypothetical protein
MEWLVYVSYQMKQPRKIVRLERVRPGGREDGTKSQDLGLGVWGRDTTQSCAIRRKWLVYEVPVLVPRKVIKPCIAVGGAIRRRSIAPGPVRHHEKRCFA